MSFLLIQQSYQAKLSLFLEKAGAGDWINDCLAKVEFAQQLERAWGCSDFAADQAIGDPQGFRQLVESGDLERAYSQTTLLDSLQQNISVIPKDDEKALGKQLRLFRRREMQRIVWRDLNRLADLTETTRDVTLLAEACTSVALDYLHPMVAKDMGKPLDSDGNEQKLLVIAYGQNGWR
jgi:glutamate-ammonia-ligase adenylyltransferase